MAKIGTARLDCLVLLEDATSKDRSYLLAHPELTLTTQQLKLLDKQITRRLTHEPLAFIRGRTEFYGREFLITNSVLEPRPESETMIELLKQQVEGSTYTVAGRIQIIDLGTGSGALAITAKLEFPDVEVFAVDIDPKCLEVAKKNAEKHQVNIKFYEGNLLEPIPSTAYRLPTILLCNLPYVPDDYHINEAAAMEPRIAIFGGPDGLDLYRELFTQLSSRRYKVEGIKYVLTESLPFQHTALADIAAEAGYKQTKEEDFIQLFELS